MAQCEVCGREYDKTFEIDDGTTHVFDCFECAIHALAPECAHCGCRIIGHGVAQVFAAGGWTVRLIGRRAESLTAARGKIRASLAQFVAKRLMSEAARKAALARIKATTRLEDAKDAELVIEAVPEDMALKRALFGRLDRICAADAHLQSNTLSRAQPHTQSSSRIARSSVVLLGRFIAA